jgi:hypothetical protein
MTRFTLTTLCLSSFVLAALPGCRPSESTTDDDGSSTNGTSSTSPGTTDGQTETTNPPLPTTSGMSDSESNATTMPDTTVTTGEPACDDVPGQPDAAACTDPSGCGCASGKCFMVPLAGGFCSECLSDADCDGGGCSTPNPLADVPVGATCNKGEPGAGCMSDDVCADPSASKCGVLIEIPNLFAVATCGECLTNADCTDPAAPNCTPVYDVANLSGQFKCMADASIPNNEGCNLADDGNGQPVGNSACMSGFCGEGSFMGLVKFGVCGDCNADEDCQMGQCQDPAVDLQTGMLTGSVCQ